jgi:hypothetical protein
MRRKYGHTTFRDGRHYVYADWWYGRDKWVNEQWRNGRKLAAFLHQEFPGMEARMWEIVNRPGSTESDYFKAGFASVALHFCVAG